MSPETLVQPVPVQQPVLILPPAMVDAIDELTPLTDEIHDIKWDLSANLPDEDGVPLESVWHRVQINLLIDCVGSFFRGREDFFAGGNMFVYFNAQEKRDRDFRGPDFFFVWGVERRKTRRFWHVWEEGGAYPSVIVELLSPTTATVDRTVKKTIYSKTFRTPEYYLYDPDTKKLEGFELWRGSYQEMVPNDSGRIWSHALGMYLGPWEGEYQDTRADWIRFFDADGNLVLTKEEDAERRAADEKRRADDEKRRADDEKRRADDAVQLAGNEKRRADDATTTVDRLRARLAELGIQE